jgi:hypothetical protein
VHVDILAGIYRVINIAAEGAIKIISVIKSMLIREYIRG